MSVSTPPTSQICTPDLVLFLACANSRLKERLEKRAEQQGRPDDNPKATERRLANFKQNAIPLVKYFQEKDLIITVSAQLAGDRIGMQTRVLRWAFGRLILIGLQLFGDLL